MFDVKNNSVSHACAKEYPLPGCYTNIPLIGKGGRFMEKASELRQFSELREHERTDFDTPVLFSNDNLENHHRAMMQNFSDKGMYFESNEYIRPGSTVYVKTINYCSVNKCEVRWCSRINAEGKEVFGIGLQCEL
ncbi:MAG: PilZ domain-containing protein [Proteobacteria bacterium]|nr:PilZ domain-containing protein [Pseudomonadota bacterium]